MKQLQSTKKYQGFSLPEVLAIVLILGIFAALGTPSFLSWVNKKRVEDVLAQVEGALKEGQASAIRTSQRCSLTITSSSVAANPSNCLPTGSRDLTQVNGRNQISGVTLVAQNPDTIEFSPKGSTSSSNVFVFYHPDQSGGMRCLAISAGIGIIRVGEFKGSFPPSSGQATPTNCHTSS
ncbi:Tfp pilus assembly protein FimT/FimU [Acaryochloris marina]|uniref:pilus assembly FimT family protein n=1 Tax=Acaryochloris marina TaxID=155978 RepID=UPI001BAFE812|nr:type IV pilin protein [Acaryochloris marina]QUY42780.1 type IV pilin protein [Acaryochloris marina S15]